MKNLCIIDIEATCYEDGSKPDDYISEIIEIGAVILDPVTFEIRDEYQTFIQPVINPILSPFCKNLTSITQEQVDAGISTVQAFEEIGAFRQKHDAVFGSWGYYDRNMFQWASERLQIPYPFDDYHVSIKHQHGKWCKKRAMGMDKALEKHKIPLDGTHHRGLDDARNIAKIATVMIQGGWRY